LGNNIKVPTSEALDVCNENDDESSENPISYENSEKVQEELKDIGNIPDEDIDMKISRKNPLMRGVSDPILRELQISTVDAFQGAEKEVIILACSRTVSLGFSDSPKRLNVALTRAKRHLFIVGRSAVLSNDRIWREIITTAKGFVGGFQSCKAIRESKRFSFGPNSTQIPKVFYEKDTELCSTITRDTSWPTSDHHFASQEEPTVMASNLEPSKRIKNGDISQFDLFDDKTMLDEVFWGALESCESMAFDDDRKPWIRENKKCISSKEEQQIPCQRKETL